MGEGQVRSIRSQGLAAGGKGGRISVGRGRSGAKGRWQGGRDAASMGGVQVRSQGLAVGGKGGRISVGRGRSGAEGQVRSQRPAAWGGETPH